MNTSLIVHLGIGAFTRAHQAWYLQHLIDRGETSWTMVVGSIRADTAPLLDALDAQAGAYTLEMVTPDGARTYEKIAAISEVVRFEPHAEKLIAAAARPKTKIVSFTVTESGYYLDPQGVLDLAHADVAADLEGGRTTIYGTLAGIVAARSRANAGPVTFLNCDNLRGNGTLIEGALGAFLRESGEPELAAWTAANATFPNAMVDRITPRSTDEVRTRVRAATGFDDRCPVMSEDFAQWVIEDHFAAGRPAWETVGAELVEDVAPYENAKLRILNASHSVISWAGTLAGFTYIHEATVDPRIHEIAHAYVTQNVIPTLRPSPIDLDAYRDVVLDRFRNPFIADTIARVAADSTAKIGGFFVPTIDAAATLGLPLESSAAVVALYFAFLERLHAKRLPYAYADGALELARLDETFSQPDPLATLLQNGRVFGPLATNAAFHRAVTLAVAGLGALR